MGCSSIEVVSCQFSFFCLFLFPFSLFSSSPSLSLLSSTSPKSEKKRKTKQRRLSKSPKRYLLLFYADASNELYSFSYISLMLFFVIYLNLICKIVQEEAAAMTSNKDATQFSVQKSSQRPHNMLEESVIAIVPIVSSMCFYGIFMAPQLTVI